MSNPNGIKILGPISKAEAILDIEYYFKTEKTIYFLLI
jgi:hypothetical protein